MVAEVNVQIQQIAQAIQMIEEEYGQLIAAYDSAIQTLESLKSGVM